MRHGWVHMFTKHRPTLTLQLHNFDLFRTSRTGLLRGNWQDFNWNDGSRGHSAIAALLVQLCKTTAHFNGKGPLSPDYHRRTRTIAYTTTPRRQIFHFNQSLFQASLADPKTYNSPPNVCQIVRSKSHFVRDNGLEIFRANFLSMDNKHRNFRHKATKRVEIYAKNEPKYVWRRASWGACAYLS